MLICTQISLPAAATDLVPGSYPGLLLLWILCLFSSRTTGGGCRRWHVAPFLPCCWLCRWRWFTPRCPAGALAPLRCWFGQEQRDVCAVDTAVSWTPSQQQSSLISIKPFNLWCALFPLLTNISILIHVNCNISVMLITSKPLSVYSVFHPQNFKATWWHFVFNLKNRYIFKNVTTCILLV